MGLRKKSLNDSRFILGVLGSGLGGFVNGSSSVLGGSRGGLGGGWAVWTAG